MGKGRSKKSAPAQPQEDANFDSPFANLAGLRDSLPAGEAPADEPSVSESRGASAATAPKRAVVRYQRKGRGGKEVTLVEKLGLPHDELETWLRDAKRDLGCGGVIEEDKLALQGDQRKRLPGWLERRGVARVTSS